VALRSVTQTEEISNNVVGELGDQTNRMGGILGKLRGFNELVGSAKGQIRTMQRRVMTNKLILFGITVVLLGAIVLISYFAFFYESGGATPPPQNDTGPWDQ